ncbi:unnamed protein product [Closterium sp. Yama58-4]|nr:unnamed protein product [Closterium sp. Yama58-4]
MGYTTGAPRQSSTQARGTSGTRRERARTGKECAESPVGRRDVVSADSYSEDEHSRTSRAPGRGGGGAGGRGASSSGNGREKRAAGSGRDGVDRADRRDRRPSAKCLEEDSTEYESKDEPTDSCTDDDFSENEEASEGSDVDDSDVDGSDVDGSDVDGSDDDGSSNRSSPRSSDRRHTGRDSNGSSRRRSDSRSPRSPESTRSPRSPESTRSPCSPESRRSLSSPESTQSPRDAKSWSGSDDNASSHEYADTYVTRSRTRASAASVDYSQRAPAGHYAAEHEHEHQHQHHHRQLRISAPPPPQHKRYASAAAVPAKNRSVSLSAASLDQAAAAIAGVSGGDEPAELMHGSNAAYAGTGGGNCGARLPAGNAAGGRVPSAQARSMRKCISGDRATMGSGSMDLDRCKQGGLGIGPRGAAGVAGGCNAPRPSGNQPGNQQCLQPVRQNVRPSAIARSMSVPDDELERTPLGGYQQQHGPSHGQGYIHGQMNGQPDYAYRQPGPGKLQMKALRRAQSGRLNPSNGSANNGSPSTSSSSRTAMPRSMSAKAPSPTPPFLPNGLIDLYPVEPLSPTEIQTPVGVPPARRDFPSLPMLDIPWCSADSPRSPPKPINVGPPLRSCSLGPAVQQVWAGGRIGVKAGQGMGAGGDGGGGRGGGVVERSMSEERRVKAQAARNAVRVVELGGPAEGSPVPHAVAVAAAGAVAAGAGRAGGEMGAVAVAGHGKKGHLRGFFASWGGH